MSRNEQKEDKIRDYLVFPNEKGTHTGMCAYNFTEMVESVRKNALKASAKGDKKRLFTAQESI